MTLFPGVALITGAASGECALPVRCFSAAFQYTTAPLCKFLATSPANCKVGLLIPGSHVINEIFLFRFVPCHSKHSLSSLTHSIGIGRATALSFAAEGCKRIILCDRDLKGLRVTHSQILASCTPESEVTVTVDGDVSTEEGVEAIFERAVLIWGRLDYCVNAAGMFRPRVFIILVVILYYLILATPSRSRFDLRCLDCNLGS